MRNPSNLSISKTISTFTILFLACFVAQAQSTKEVLFIGNSYTAYNSLGSLTASLALSAGDNLIQQQHSPGGQNFSSHSTNTTAQALIASENWDYVVLQGQSQEPSFPLSQVESQTFPYAQSLCESIRANDPCTRPMFFMTWGRENGDVGNCAAWPPVCTYEGMDDLLRERYQIMGQMNEAYVSPVGAVWRLIRLNNPEIDLYSADGSHPSAAGSYAAACTFYSMIFEADPLNITSNSNVPAEQALSIRQAAHTVCFSSLAQWNVGEFDPDAHFYFTIDGLTVNFTDASHYATSGYWLFDGVQGSPEVSVSMTYPEPGIYYASRVVESCGLVDTLTLEVDLTINVGVEEHRVNELTFSPNPVSDMLSVNFDGQVKLIEIYDLNGQVILNSDNIDIDVSKLGQGQYFVSLRSQAGEISVGRFVKL